MSDRAFLMSIAAVIINGASIFWGFQRISNLETQVQQLTNQPRAEIQENLTK